MLTIDVKSAEDGCNQDLDMYLVDPLGERVEDEWVWSSCQGHGPYELDKTGEYQLLFVGGDGGSAGRTTGDYSYVATLDLRG